MRKVVTLMASFVVIALIATLVSAASEPKAVTQPVTVKVVERPTTDKVVDVGKSGDSTGDILTFHNVVYDFQNKKKVGRDQGVCIRIDHGEASWECRWITFLPDGAITVEGPFYDDRDSTLAITGGRATYRNARGTMEIKARHGGEQYAFIFNILP
ncbi:MAG: allene oxide cyclase family protein [Myxococcota bacterium]|jgi:Allene oxide cyclase